MNRVAYGKNVKQDSTKGGLGEPKRISLQE